MTRQAVVVRRKIDTPTAVVARLGIESFSLPAEFVFDTSEKNKDVIKTNKQTKTRCNILL